MRDLTEDKGFLARCVREGPPWGQLSIFLAVRLPQERGFRAAITAEELLLLVK